MNDTYNSNDASSEGRIVSEHRPVPKPLFLLISLGALVIATGSIYYYYTAHFDGSLFGTNDATTAAEDRAQFLAQVETERGTLPVETTSEAMSTVESEEFQGFKSALESGEVIVEDETLEEADLSEQTNPETEDTVSDTAGVADTAADSSVSGPDFDTSEEPREFKATVLAVDTTNSTLLVMPETDAYEKISIFIDADTQLSINSLEVSVSEISPFDVVAVTGWQVESEVLAQEVLVTALFDVNGQPVAPESNDTSN